MTNLNEGAALMFTAQIHKHFRARCRKPLVLTIDDWSCIQRWQEQRIPLDSVLRGIDRAFTCNTGEVTSLLHCRWAVEEVAGELSRSA